MADRRARHRALPWLDDRLRPARPVPPAFPDELRRASHEEISQAEQLGLPRQTETTKSPLGTPGPSATICVAASRASCWRSCRLRAGRAAARGCRDRLVDMSASTPTHEDVRRSGSSASAAVAYAAASSLSPSEQRRVDCCSARRPDRSRSCESGRERGREASRFVLAEGSARRRPTRTRGDHRSRSETRRVTVGNPRTSAGIQHSLGFRFAADCSNTYGSRCT
jgi:hypothetical protein